MAVPLVSVITITYNHESYIGQCIESVLAQTFDNWEMIIIDDGSTDHTPSIIQSYKDQRIYYIRQDNVGIWRLGESYNKALSIARGELIAILEGDDYWPSDKLEKQVPSFKEHDVILCWGKNIAVNNEGKVIAIGPRKVTNSLYTVYNNEPPGKILTHLLVKGNFIAACTLVIRKEALMHIGGFKQPKNCPSVDYSTILSLALQGRFCFINDIVGYWRWHMNQASKTYGLEMARAFSQYIKEFYHSLPVNIKSTLKLDECRVLSFAQTTLATGYFYQGRLALIQDKRREAILNFKKAFALGGWSRKLKAVVGILCALTHTDIWREYTDCFKGLKIIFRSPE